MRYEKGDPSVRNGHGGLDSEQAAENASGPQEQKELECPRCGEVVENLPLHMRKSESCGE